MLFLSRTVSTSEAIFIRIRVSLDGFAITIVSPLAAAMARNAAFTQPRSGRPKETLDSPTIVQQPNEVLHQEITFRVSAAAFWSTRPS